MCLVWGNVKALMFGSWLFWLFLSMAHIKIEQPKCWGVTQFWWDKFSPFCFVILVSGEKCRFWKITKGRQTWFKGTKRIKRQLKMHTNLKLLKGIAYVHNFSFPTRQIVLGKKTWGDYYFLTRFGTLQFIFSGGFSPWFVITWRQFCMNFETIFFNILHWWWCWGWWWVRHETVMGREVAWVSQGSCGACSKIETTTNRKFASLQATHGCKNPSQTSMVPWTTQTQESAGKLNCLSSKCIWLVTTSTLDFFFL